MSGRPSQGAPPTLYGIGVGPGDPGLITVKGLEILRRVPVVYVPKSREEAGSFAVSVVEGYLDRNHQEVIDLVFPMCKDREGLVAFWERSAGMILDRLGRGLDVACICIGDPLLYSTFALVVERVRERNPAVRVEVVPGVTSIAACAARLNLPLAQGGERIAILPATYDLAGVKNTLRDFECVVLMKVHSVMDQVLDLLAELGLEKQAVFVSRGTTGAEEIVRDVASLRGRELDYHSLMIIKNPSPPGPLTRTLSPEGRGEKAEG